MGFGSLGFSELAVIFIIVLVFFGPRRFPEIARSMGSAMREFRRSLNQIQRELEEADPRRDIPGRDILSDIRAGKPGSWLDPDRTGTPPGVRNPPESPAPQATGERSGAAAPAPDARPAHSGSTDAGSMDRGRPDDARPGGEEEQLPMFEGGGDPEESPTDGTRSD